MVVNGVVVVLGGWEGAHDPLLSMVDPVEHVKLVVMAVVVVVTGVVVSEVLGTLVVAAVVVVLEELVPG